MEVSSPLKSPITVLAGLYRGRFPSDAVPFKLCCCANSGPGSAWIQSSTFGSAISHVESSSSLKSIVRTIQPIRATTNEGPPVVQSCKKALISLSDKRDLSFLANGLQSLGYSIVSTGETTSALAEAGVPVTRVEELTFFPNMLQVLLTSNMFGGFHARTNHEHHIEALNKHGIETFDVVVVNLYYVFEKVSSTSGFTFWDIMKHAEIRRPASIREAERHKDVLVVVDHEDYPSLLEYLQGEQDDQKCDQHFRKALASKATRHILCYVEALLEWWNKALFAGYKFSSGATVPLSMERVLRYVENPHRRGAFGGKRLSMVNPISDGIATALQHHGKEMSCNNYDAANIAWKCVSEFKIPTCVIVNHTYSYGTPCGVASRQDILEAYRLAVKADPDSAFGGIVAFNTTIDEDLAQEIQEFWRMNYEMIVAPKYTEKGLDILCDESNTLMILEARKSDKGVLSLKEVGGRVLAQESDDITTEDTRFNVMSQRIPREDELHDAEFAWLCVKHVGSAIVIAKNNCMLGIGSGQPTRLENLRIALGKAGEEAKGAALANDLYFLHAWKDVIEEACQNGIAVIVGQAGSPRDVDAVDCCNKYGVSLLFTNERAHFGVTDDD